MHKLGWCAGIDEAETYRQLGFDYLECTLTSLKLEDAAAYAEQLPKFLSSPLPVRAFNVFFPGGMMVVGPEADPNRIRHYVSLAAEALSRIGASVAVLGSGRARHIPEGWERGRAEEQFLQLLEWMADDFTDAGVTLVIEPLNCGESNFINSVADAVKLAEQINRKSIMALADLYHMEIEREPLETIVAHKTWLAHIHVSEKDRALPGTGNHPFKETAEQLRLAGYTGMISAECNNAGVSPSQIADSLAFMKRMFHSN